MNVHHVGIVCPDSGLLERLRAIGGVGAGTEIAYRHVPEFGCDCYLVGHIELVVPTGPRSAATPLQRWLAARGTSLHHIAFEVEDVDVAAASFRQAGLPVVLDSAVEGVAGLRVNFIHPSYCGFLLEIVQPESAAQEAAA